MTLEFAGEAVGISHAQLGRIERGLQPYNQALLEKLAYLYKTTEASLIMRDPSDPDNLWSVWDQAKPAEREKIEEYAIMVRKTGTGS